MAILVALVLAVPLLSACGSDEGEIVVPAPAPAVQEEVEEAVEATAEAEAEQPAYPAGVDSNPETMGEVHEWWTANGGTDDEEFVADYPRIWEEWVAAGRP